MRLVLAVRLSRTAEDVCPYKPWGRSFAAVRLVLAVRSQRRQQATALQRIRSCSHLRKASPYGRGGGVADGEETLFALNHTVEKVVRSHKKPSLVREGGIDEPQVRVNDG